MINSSATHSVDFLSLCLALIRRIHLARTSERRKREASGCSILTHSNESTHSRSAASASFFLSCCLLACVSDDSRYCNLGIPPQSQSGSVFLIKLFNLSGDLSAALSNLLHGTVELIPMFFALSPDVILVGAYLLISSPSHGIGTVQLIPM